MLDPVHFSEKISGLFLLHLKFSFYCKLVTEGMVIGRVSVDNLLFLTS